MQISAAFDSGNILVKNANDPADIVLEIKKDVGEDHFQWFHFRLTGARGQELRMRLGNAAEASYPDGWHDYRACASYDRKTWFRVPTSFVDSELVIEHQPQADSVYYAYFAPYSAERHADFLASIQGQEGVELRLLGRSVDGRDLDLVVLSSPEAEHLAPPKVCWIVGRQHPGETMAEWLVEGLLERLLDGNDPVAQECRRRARFFIVPNMNPDGSVRGHLRNNAAGANLNREWQEPSQERSPEVFYTRQAMVSEGVDFFLDVHGDEALPYNFIAGAEGVPRWSVQAAERQQRYLSALAQASPDFQTEHGYPVSMPGTANLKIGCNWVAEHFGCLSMTLEQPFKDTVDRPQAQGWSPARAKCLGRAQLDALLATFELL
ncbi:MAG: M14-type cytosolic carboxypeptidase [Polyangiaceae bacterium]|nr:M14-type cytosolic carboxypeptidase [Polyangiaceae bacterium]